VKFVLKIKAVFDTNIYISAFLTQGTPLRLLRSAVGRGRKIDLYVSFEILKETARVLGSPKFLWPDGRIRKAVSFIDQIAISVEPDERIRIISVDDADNRVLECALTAAAQYIVSGDRHLLSVGEFSGIKILSPADFLRVVEEQHE
jgi:uncharacterized protein